METFRWANRCLQNTLKSTQQVNATLLRQRCNKAVVCLSGEFPVPFEFTNTIITAAHVSMSVQIRCITLSRGEELVCSIQVCDTVYFAVIYARATVRARVRVRVDLGRS